MNIYGIIAEYNPFHSGHLYHIEQARAAGATHIVAVMSGNFVQRGDAAICDKWARTEMALRCGCDLILELPVCFAAATAQRFALGAVGTLDALGCVDTLCFGSESGDTGQIIRTAEMLNNEQVLGKMHSLLEKGIAFASARQAALSSFSDSADILSNPNDTLAVEYISAVNRLGSKMIPFAVKRKGASHDGGIRDEIASASYLRQLINSDRITEAVGFMPQKSVDILMREINSGRCPADLRKLDTATLAILRKMSADDLLKLPDISEGLENRLFKAIRKASSVNEIIEMTKSKRYTHARIRRIVLSALLGISDAVASCGVKYIHVLGMNSLGREILACAKPTLPLLSRAKDKALLDSDGLEMLREECTADDIYGLCCNSIQTCGKTFTQKIINI